MNRTPLADNSIENAQAALPSDEDRRKVLSGVRIKVILSAMVVIIILLLAGTIFTLVDGIFASLTPTLKRDLVWKTARGVAELSKTTELAVVAEDVAAIGHAARHYVADEDVLAVVVYGPNDRELFSDGRLPPGESLDKITPENQKATSWRPRIELFHWPLALGTALLASYYVIAGGRAMFRRRPA